MQTYLGNIFPDLTLIKSTTYLLIITAMVWAALQAPERLENAV